MSVQQKRQRQRLHEEIAAFAEAHAGTELDLDEDLERAGIEALRNEGRQNLDQQIGTIDLVR